MTHKVYEAFSDGLSGEVECHDLIKEHLDELRDYWFNGYENESPEYSGRFAHQKNVANHSSKN